MNISYTKMGKNYNPKKDCPYCGRKGTLEVIAKWYELKNNGTMTKCQCSKCGRIVWGCFSMTKEERVEAEAQEAAERARKEAAERERKAREEAEAAERELERARILQELREAERKAARKS